MIARERHHIADLVHSYLVQQEMENACVTARDIVRFHQLPKKSSHSISAFLTRLYHEGSTGGSFGVSVTGRQQDKKTGSPYCYFIKLLKGDMHP